MNDSSKFFRLSEIASELHRKIELLQQGTLSITELEKLTNESRELYERLVVLRYKAYDGEVKGVQQNTESTEEEETPMPVINFKIDEPKVEAPIQVSLIDAIEEVTKSEAIAAPVENEIIEQQEEETIEEEEEVVMSTPDNDIPQQIVTPEYSLQDVLAEISQKESLHDKLAKTIGLSESLAQKLEHNPIPDLKRAITLNQRFQFSKELFKGNNQDYEVAIDKLNTATRDEAMKHLDSLRSKYAWNNESPVASDFVELVERRHQ